MDVRTAIGEAMGDKTIALRQVSGRGGRPVRPGSKEFTPAMVKAVFDNLDAKPAEESFHRRHQRRCHAIPVWRWTNRSILGQKVYTAMFYGLGSDGTVGANKNTIKIIGEETDNYAQGYFVYDSKKAGAMTVSHLRFGKDPIRSPYLVNKADFVACHNPSFLERYDMLANVKTGGTFLLTSTHSADQGLGYAAGRSAEADHQEETEILSSSMPSASPKNWAWALAST